MPDVNLITGDLTVSGISNFLSNTFIPSGYTNKSFSINRGDGSTSVPYKVKYLKSNGTETLTPADPLATGMRGYIEITNLNWSQLSRHVRTQRFTIETGNSLSASLFKEAYNTSFLNATGITVPYTAANGPMYSRAKFTLMTLDQRLDHIENSGVFALMPDEKIGFGTFQPQEKVHVNGNIKVQNTGFFKKLIINNQEVGAVSSPFPISNIQYKDSIGILI